MTLDIPYFMQNPEWYYHDAKEGIYKLTNKAPKEARKSYKEFYHELNEAHLGIPPSKDLLLKKQK